LKSLPYEEEAVIDNGNLYNRISSVGEALQASLTVAVSNRKTGAKNLPISWTSVGGRLEKPPLRGGGGYR